MIKIYFNRLSQFTLQIGMAIIQVYNFAHMKPNKCTKKEKHDYEKLQKVGEGAYGAVYKARDTKTNDIVALKITKFERSDEGVPSTTLRQMTLLNTLDHKNLIKLRDICLLRDRGQYAIQFAFDYFEEDLSKRIRRKPKIPESEYKPIFRQICQGIAYMHSKNTYHRDLKPQNILINSQNIVQVADFGLGRIVHDKDRTYSKEIETLWYRSPELMLGMVRYDVGAVDAWSLGCILYELAEGRVLFKGNSEFCQIMKIFQTFGTPRVDEWPELVKLPHFKKTFPKFSPKWLQTKKLNENGISLLYQLLMINPMKRITMKEVMEHQYWDDPIGPDQ